MWYVPIGKDIFRVLKNLAAGSIVSQYRSTIYFGATREPHPNVFDLMNNGTDNVKRVRDT